MIVVVCQTSGIKSVIHEKKATVWFHQLLLVA